MSDYENGILWGFFLCISARSTDKKISSWAFEQIDLLLKEVK